MDMTQITSRPQGFQNEKIKLQLDEDTLTMEAAMTRAREKARAINPDAMMLSWHSGKTGDYWPQYECGAVGGHPWEVFANARGCNLIINVNDGAYVFYFLKL